MLAQVAALLPAGLEVVVVADRAYAIPSFLERLAGLAARPVRQRRMGHPRRARESVFTLRRRAVRRRLYRTTCPRSALALA